MESAWWNKVVGHIQRFVVWWRIARDLFPPLWDAAASFAPLVMSRCDVCAKPKTVFWFHVGDHSMCDRIR